MANLFLDTEFTSLEAPHLISLALVAEDGEHVYVEMDSWRTIATPSDFVRQAVLPQLTGPTMTPVQAMSAVAAFVERYNCPSIWTDAPLYDGPLLADLLGPDAPQYTLQTIGVSQGAAGAWHFVEVDDYRRALLSEFDRPGVRRHHALDDARASLAAWQRARRIERHEALSPIGGGTWKPPG